MFSLRLALIREYLERFLDFVDSWVEFLDFFVVVVVKIGCLFFSLVQLLHKLSIRAADGPKKLLKVRYARCFACEII